MKEIKRVTPRKRTVRCNRLHLHVCRRLCVHRILKACEHRTLCDPHVHCALRLNSSTRNIRALRKRHVKRLLSNTHLTMKFGDRLNRCLSLRDAHKVKPARVTLFVPHYLSRRSSQRFKLCAQTVVVDVVVQILEIEFCALIIFMCSLRIIWNLLRFSASRAAFFWSEHTMTCFPPISLLFISSTALLAISGDP